MTTPTPCARCHAPARVHMLEGYRQGAPVYRSVCLDCAGQLHLPRPPREGRPRLPLSSLAVLLGALLGILAVFTDLLAALPGGSIGFGWQQRWLTAIGGGVALLGALLGIELVLLGGGALFVFALSADWLHVHAASGIGWKQQVLLLVAAVLMLAGLLSQPRRFLRSRSANGALERSA